MNPTPMAEVPGSYFRNKEVMVRKEAGAQKNVVFVSMRLFRKPKRRFV